jgi:hypothetical protein
MESVPNLEISELRAEICSNYIAVRTAIHSRESLSASLQDTSQRM